MKILQISILFLLLGSSCKNTSIQQSFDENGNLSSAVEKKEDGILHGISKNYIENRLFSVETYSEGALNGKREIYYADGSVEIAELYKNGKLEGPYYVYHPNGQEMLKANYINGSMEGIVVSYFDDGNVKEEVTFKNGEENGPFKEFFLNGKVKWEGTYVPGKEEPNEIGELKNYNAEGTLIRKLQCDTIYGYNKCKTIWSIDGTDTEGEKAILNRKEEN